MGRSLVVLIGVGSLLVGAVIGLVLKSERLVDQIVQRENRAPWYLRGSRSPIGVITIRRRLALQVTLLGSFAVFCWLASAISLITG